MSKENIVKIKSGMIVTFICSMNRTHTGKAVRKSGNMFIDTKERFYLLDNVQKIIKIEDK